jgi:hypothetical protein
MRNIWLEILNQTSIVSLHKVDKMRWKRRKNWRNDNCIKDFGGKT